MSKTLVQLTETTTIDTNDILHIVDISANQDKKMKAANLWSQKPHGELYWTNNATDTVTNLGGAVNINAGASAINSSAGLTNKFTHDASNARLTYTGEEDIIVEIVSVFSIGTASSAQIVIGDIYKTGASIAKARQEHVIGTTGTNSERIMTLRCLTTMSKNDYIETFITVAGVQNARATYYNLTVKAL